jgi:hypothetical protein
MVAPVLMAFGTPEQQQSYLPRIASGDDWWAQGYSEPATGSDLAALQCRAVSDGDDYIINGSKIWTTHAHFSNMMFCLVRTRVAEKPQIGISFLVFPLDRPGIDIRPIRSMSGEHELNEVFFSDVRVPKTSLVGNENDGWTVAKYLLQHERAHCWSPLLFARLDRMRTRLEAARAAIRPSQHRLLVGTRQRRGPAGTRDRGQRAIDQREGRTVPLDDRRRKIDLSQRPRGLDLRGDQRNSARHRRALGPCPPPELGLRHVPTALVEPARKASALASDTTSLLRPRTSISGNIIAEGVRLGRFREVDPDMLYFSLTGACDFIFSSAGAIPALIGEDGVTDTLRRRYIAHVTDLYMAALTKPAAS